MHRSLARRILLGCLAAIVLFVAMLVLFDWNRAKPWLGARISDATDRPFAINGDLSLEWRRGGLHEAGWRSWIPWPHLRAQDIRLGNPPGMQAEDPFAHIAQLRFSLNPWPLLTRDIVIPVIYLDQAQFHLERNKEGRNNWTFGAGEESQWEMHIHDVQLRNGSIRVIDAMQQVDATVDIDSIPPQQDAVFRAHWTVQGSMQQQKVSGKGRAGALLALGEQRSPFPLEASLRVGDTALAIDGTVTGIPAFDEADLKLNLSGQSMAHLYPILNVLLPHTPQYSTEGHLLKTGTTWRYQEFRGQVGKSDLRGDLVVETGGERTRLEGQIVSNQLRLEDLGPLAGGGDKENLGSQAENRRQPKDKVLPVGEFNTQNWQVLDADVTFRVKRFMRNEDFPLENMRAHLKLENAVLSLSPLNFGMADGKLNSDVRLDGSGDKIRAAISLSAWGLKLGELFPDIEEMDASIGEMNARAKLTGTGNSVADMLGSANGEVKALISEGSLSKLLLEAIGLNIGSVIVTKLFGDEQVPLHCMAADLEVRDGVMRSRGFIVDTEEAIFRAGGKVDLAQEELDIIIHPENKEMRIVSLRSPIYVRGKFDDPQIDVNEGSIAAQAGGALALGLAAPVATALLPLINPGDEEEKEKSSACYSLLQRAQAEPEAPPTEKSGQ